MTKLSFNRRDFLKVMGTAGTSLVIGIYLSGCDTEPEIQEGPSKSQATACGQPATRYLLYPQYLLDH